jgi:CheY-like chemotaxis protein
MRAHQAKHPVATMSRVLGVSASGFYAWCARSFAPQVISDISMPDEDGYDLLSSLRRRPSGTPQRLFAVALTGVGNNNTRGSEAGFACFLAKPVDLAALVRALREGRE